jgi:hypothetical protein
MPSINVNIAAGGPLLIAQVNVSLPRRQALIAVGRDLPSAVSGTFLVDTGASCTCVDPALVASLGLQPTGQVNISTPSTAGRHHVCEQYDVSIFIPSSTPTAGRLIPAIPILATHLQSQGIDGLLGRDVLNEGIFIYNASAGMFTIAY